MTEQSLTNMNTMRTVGDHIDFVHRGYFYSCFGQALTDFSFDTQVLFACALSKRGSNGHFKIMVFLH